jgi:hypothetical protein
MRRIGRLEMRRLPCIRPDRFGPKAVNVGSFSPETRPIRAFGTTVASASSVSWRIASTNRDSRRPHPPGQPTIGGAKAEIFDLHHRDYWLIIVG